MIIKIHIELLLVPYWSRVVWVTIGLLGVVCLPGVCQSGFRVWAISGRNPKLGVWMPLQRWSVTYHLWVTVTLTSDLISGLIVGIPKLVCECILAFAVKAYVPSARALNSPVSESYTSWSFRKTLENFSASLSDGLLLSTHRAEKAYDGRFCISENKIECITSHWDIIQKNKHKLCLRILQSHQRNV